MRISIHHVQKDYFTAISGWSWNFNNSAFTSCITDYRLHIIGMPDWWKSFASHKIWQLCHNICGWLYILILHIVFVLIFAINLYFPQSKIHGNTKQVYWQCQNYNTSWVGGLGIESEMSWVMTRNVTKIDYMKILNKN